VDDPIRAVPWCEITTNFDSVFWFGSLHYDAGGKSLREVSAPVSPEAWQELSQGDTFTKEQREAGILHNFRSGTLDFQPTFPVMTELEAIKAKSAAYDETSGLRGYQKERKDVKSDPMWADRILFHCLPGVKVQQLSFKSVPSICSSSHVPVCSVFALNVDTLPMRVPPAPPFKGARMRFHWRELRAHLTGSWHMSAQTEDAHQLVTPSKVFMVFSGRFLENSACETPVASPDLGLYDWNVKNCPVLQCKRTLDGTEAPLLHIDVFQNNARGGLQPLGSCVIALHDRDGGWVVGSEARTAMEFKSNLTLSGYPAGTVTGRLGVEWYSPFDEQSSGVIGKSLWKLGGLLEKHTTPTPKVGQPVARVQARTSVKIDPIIEVEGLRR